MKIKSRGKRIFSLLLAGVFLLLSMSMVEADRAESAVNPNRKTVRVGYPIQHKLTDKNTEGEYTGYNVDYLAEVVKYTKWDIEYVEIEGDLNTQLNTLSDMLDSGEIDMMGTMLLNEYTQDLYLYPTYSYGSTYTALAVADNSHYWSSDNFSDWNGITVASYKGLQRRMALLEEFARVSGFTYEVKEYETLEEVVDAVYSGEADACLQVDINIEDGLRAIARFSPNPYYFAITKGREDLLRDLNNAMYSILEYYPGLQSELYSKYFMHTGSFHLSNEDRAWVESLPTMRVLYFEVNTPIQNKSGGEAVGVAASFFKELEKATGLKTEPIFTGSYDEGVRLVEEGGIDMVAAMTSLSTVYAEHDIRLSAPYFKSSAVKVLRGDLAYPESVPHRTVNIESVLNLLKAGRIEGAIVDSYCADYYLNKKSVYDKIYAEWLNGEMILYSVGFMPTVDERLTGIINAFANSLSEQTKQEMIYSASRQPLRYSALEMLEIYHWQILTVLAVIAAVILFMSRKRHSRILKESTREAEQLYEFSRMVNEYLIRYDVRQDRLILQNSRLVFSGREVLCPFIRADIEKLSRDDNERRTAETLQKMLGAHTVSSEVELHSGGSPRWHRIDLVYISDEYAVGRMYDIEDEVERRDELERKANRDSLTGLLNRAALEEFLQEYLPRSSEGIFLLMDLDNFKNVNDTMGHVEGDKVLQSFAGFIETAFRADDLKVRLGGDEFVAFLQNDMPRERLAAKLQYFMERSEEIFKDYRDCCLSVSVGAAYVKSGGSFESLYTAADDAMYKAKQGGKGQFFIEE